MIRRPKYKEGFTLIEVMVAVMIISVVIMATIQMYANNTFIFANYKNKTQTNQYMSFLIANEKYGLENDTISMYRLVEDFDVEIDLRRKLKAMKINIIYQELKIIDFDGDEEENRDENTEKESSSIVFEIGKSIISSSEYSSGLVRFRVQD